MEAEMIMSVNGAKSILLRFAQAAAAAAAAFLIVSGGVYASEDTSGEDAGARAYERIAKEAAETIGETEEKAAAQMREEMMDPEGKDAIISASGKMLRRSDGRWLTPEDIKSGAGKFTIAFTGDVIFDRGQNPWAASAYSSGIESCFDEDSWELMHDADVLVVNNEFAYTDRGSAVPGKKFTFRCPPETADWLKELGTDLAALANNHIYDYGEEGILDTFDTLDEEEIPYIGAGRDLEDAHKPAYCIVNGTVVAILNATEIERYENPETRGAEEDAPGVFRCLDDEDLCDKVREAKEKADLCIVFVHWGTELMPAAEWSQVDKAEDLAETGLYDYISDELLEKDRTHSVIHVYGKDREDADRLMKEIFSGLAREGIDYSYDSQDIHESDWSEKWKDFYKPVRIGEKIVVCPTWLECDTHDGEKKLLLDPGMAFGTGQHETTRLCLEKLCIIDTAGKKVLDMGCGSGILGISAVLLGAENAVCVDVDERCTETTAFNAGLNDTADRVSIYTGNVLDDPGLASKVGSEFDIVLANIVADVIIMYKDYFRSVLKDGGILITGGIIEGRENEVIEELMTAGFNVDEIRKEKNWYSVAFL